MSRRQYEQTTRYLDADAKTVFTSLRGQGVSIESWIDLSQEPARWGVRVRAEGRTHQIGDRTGTNGSPD